MLKSKVANIKNMNAKDLIKKYDKLSDEEQLKFMELLQECNRRAFFKMQGVKYKSPSYQDFIDHQKWRKEHLK